MWRKILRTNFTSWQTLANYLELDANAISKQSTFPLNLPKRLADKCEKGNIEDPILRQFLPSPDEEIAHPGDLRDPVGDQDSQRLPRLLHKYRGRALLITSSACAMHCRYCFRRHFDYARKAPFGDELRVISRDTSLSEVILSGGDPLSLPNERLGPLLEALSQIPHIKRIRFHSRFPIGIPERLDEGFCHILEQARPQIIFVIHCNHARELDQDITSALARLNVPLLNQAVLLKGVNDDKKSLKDLCEALCDNGIIPYYLHQLDRVEGGRHFEVDPEKGLLLLSELEKELPGYAIPRYVQEVAGEAHKVTCDRLYQCQGA